MRDPDPEKLFLSAGRHRERQVNGLVDHALILADLDHERVAEAFQSLTCAWMAGATLLGLTLNALLHWTWADPVAALLIREPFISFHSFVIGYCNNGHKLKLTTESIDDVVKDIQCQ